MRSVRELKKIIIIIIFVNLLTTFSNLVRVFSNCYSACTVIFNACGLGCLVVLICRLVMDSEIFDALIEGCSFEGWGLEKKGKDRAMLAKQGWRLLSEHSLIVRILKARYFKYRSFLLQSMVITLILYLVKSSMGAWCSWTGYLVTYWVWVTQLTSGRLSRQLDSTAQIFSHSLQCLILIQKCLLYYWMPIAGMILCCGVFCVNGCWIHFFNSFA